MKTWKGGIQFLIYLTTVAAVCTRVFRGLHFPLQPTLTSPYAEVEMTNLYHYSHFSFTEKELLIKRTESLISSV